MRYRRAMAILVAATFWAGAARGQDVPKNIVPVPDYSGDFWSRSHLTGDWGGTRTELARQGLQATLDFTQVGQSVVGGGVSNGTAYGGNLDLTGSIDLNALGVIPGAFVMFRVESRYGTSVNGIAGPFLPVNTDADFPLSRTPDDNVPIAVTDLEYFQALSPQLVVFGGKLDTLDADLNEFASGRGTKQFMNITLMGDSTFGLGLPYSTLGAGVAWTPIPNLTITGLAASAADASRSSGFDTFDEKGYLATVEADYQYRLGELPGGANLGGFYGWDNKFAKLGQWYVTGAGTLAPTNKSDTWVVYASGWQYLWCDRPAGDAKWINTKDGRADYRGVGLFGRASIADRDTNPVAWTASGGVGQRGLLAPGRDEDSAGVGIYYSSIQAERLSEVGVPGHTQGLEAYYDLAITPAAHLTFDVEVVKGARPDVDTSVILGLRLDMVF